MRTDDTLLRDPTAEAASPGRTPVAPPLRHRSRLVTALYRASASELFRDSGPPLAPLHRN